MDTWHGYTPDCHELALRRERGLWTVRCGANKAQNRILDGALIERSGPGLSSVRSAFRTRSNIPMPDGKIA